MVTLLNKQLPGKEHRLARQGTSHLDWQVLLIVSNGEEGFVLLKRIGLLLP
jgi:hypothetical protein